MEVESVFMVDGADSFREAYFEPCAVGREPEAAWYAHEHLWNQDNTANNTIEKNNSVSQHRWIN